jgi:hypothetical protein
VRLWVRLGVRVGRHGPGENPWVWVARWLGGNACRALHVTLGRTILHGSRNEAETHDNMSATSERVQRHRERLRASGLRPIQIWVPDTRRPGFAEECRRQSRLLIDDPLERETLDWLDDVADRTGWE